MAKINFHPERWVDFSRRNDPAHKAGVGLLKETINAKGAPGVLCFWTKNPKGIADLYGDVIRRLQELGTLVLAQVTVTGYGRILEPGVPNPELEGLVSLLGSEAIRLRFDPIIKGYTKPEHFHKCLGVAQNYGIQEIIVNFMVPSYKDVGCTIKRVLGINPINPTKEDMLSVLDKIRSMTPEGIRLRACAETHFTLGKDKPEWLGNASCADPIWAKTVKPSLANILGRGSRKGCGCCYSDDYGQYASNGGYKCPHGCIYCYAK